MVSPSLEPMDQDVSAENLSSCTVTVTSIQDTWSLAPHQLDEVDPVGEISLAAMAGLDVDAGATLRAGPARNVCFEEKVGLASTVRNGLNSFTG